MGRDLGVPRGIPTTSEIFTPIIFSQYFTHADESKIFYSDRLANFKEDFRSIMSIKSSFVKKSEASFVLGGYFVEVKFLSSENNSDSSGYEITLKNSTGDRFIQRIKPTEASNVKMFLRSLSSVNFSREESGPSDLKPGDYVLIKRSTNLLNPAESNIEIEILRQTGT